MSYRFVAIHIALITFAIPSVLRADETWRSLFNGKDLTGWQVIDGNTKSWKVVDGVLTTDGTGGWLSTIDEFDDFELELQFRPTSPGANSGIFLRAPHAPKPSYAGMEIQLLDDYAAEYKNLKPYQYTGGLYGLAGPTARVSKPVGQWQEISVHCRSRKIQITLNRQLIVDANLNNYNEQTAEHPGIVRSSGYVGLQSHGGSFEYRQIRIRK